MNQAHTSSPVNDDRGAPLVVVADDEPDLVMVLQIKLSRSGFAVIAAPDGRTAEHLIRVHRPALAILDITMPHKSGIDVVHDLRAAGLMLPIILLSARAADDDIAEGLTAGATAYLTKPFSPNQLLEQVHEVLADTAGQRLTADALLTDTKTKDISSNRVADGPEARGWTAGT